MTSLADQDLLIAITVHGHPAPKGSKTPKGRATNGKIIMVESSAKAKPWHNAVKAATEEIIGDFHEPYTGPLKVEVWFTVVKPISAPKRLRTWPVKRSSGDLDKLVRNTLDPMQEAGLFHDDSQVVELSASKAYPSEGPNTLLSPGAVITVRSVAVMSESQTGLLTQ